MSPRGADREGTAATSARLIEITLDESLRQTTSPDIDHEREVAIYDLVENNRFSVAGAYEGPFRLHLAIVDQRLVFAVGDENGDPCTTIALSLSPFRRVVRDYFLVCESYYEAIRTAPPSRIEAIDMGRRGLHDEGSRILQQRLAGKAELDFATARRLFTLVCALHWKG